MKFLQTYLSHLFIFLSINASAYNSDSLELSLKSMNDDTLKIKTLLLIYENYIDTDNNKAQLYLTQAILLAQKQKDKKLLGLCYFNQATLFEHTGQFDKSLKYYLEAIKIYEAIGYQKGIGQCYNSIGVIFWYQDNYIKALQYMQKAMSINQAHADKYAVAINLANMAIVYDSKKNSDSALIMYQNALKIFYEYNNNTAIANCHNNIGLLYIELEKYDEAIKNFILAGKIWEDNNNIAGRVTVLNNLGYCYLKSKQYTKAISYLERALPISRKLNSKYDQKLILKNLASAYAGLNKYDLAYKYQNEYNIVKDSLLNEEKNKQLSELEIKFNTEKIQQQNNLLKKEKELEKIAKDERDKAQQLRNTFQISGLLLAGILALMFYIRYNEKKKSNMQLEEKNMQITLQKQVIEQKNKDITDSISYAQTIQVAILPGEEIFKNSFADAFVLFKPRDIVSGDFYWYKKTDGKICFAVADCTGHGVPGAMMSMIGNDLLNHAVNDKNITDPAQVLKYLDIALNNLLRANNKQHRSNDGMDIVFCCLKQKSYALYELAFAAAQRPLWVIRANGEFEEYNPAKISLGNALGYNEEFVSNTIELKKGDAIYLFSDGYADQFGGEKEKKMLQKRFKAKLLSLHNNNMYIQKNELEAYYNKWKGSCTQIDDVCIVGLQV